MAKQQHGRFSYLLQRHRSPGSASAPVPLEPAHQGGGPPRSDGWPCGWKLPLRPGSPAEQIIAGTQMHGLVGVLEQTVGRNKDHLALRALFQHGAGCIQTVHTGHLNVHQDQVCAPQHRRIRCLAAVLRQSRWSLRAQSGGPRCPPAFPVPVLRHPRSTDESFLKLLPLSFSTNGRYSTTAVPRPG